MQSHVARDFEWQAAFLQKLTDIIQPYYWKAFCSLRPASLELDMNKAADIGSDMALVHDAFTASCRIRKAYYYLEGNPEWRKEITITTRRESGGPCEYPKLVSGCATWFAYGMVDNDDPSKGNIRVWHIVDLNGWRKYNSLYPNYHPEMPNKDAIGQRCFWKPWVVPDLAARMPGSVVASSLDIAISKESRSPNVLDSLF